MQLCADATQPHPYRASGCASRLTDVSTDDRTCSQCHFSASLANSGANGDTGADADADADTHTHAGADADADCGTASDTYCGTDAYSNTNPAGCSVGAFHAKEEKDADADTHAYDYTHADADAYAYPRDAYTDSGVGV